MLVFPNAKINIGLNIVERRTDGYHNIETVFYPLNNLYEALEVVDSKEFALHISGITITDNIEQNLITKAYRLLQRDFGLPPQAFYLKKSIPMGAGLGGGSADAAFALKALNSKFDLRLPPDTLREYALQLGADCPFFINNKASFAQGKGEILSTTALDLSGKYLLAVKPDIHIDTKLAYAGVVPKQAAVYLPDAVKKPMTEWKNLITNDFEKNTFSAYPILQEIKTQIYDLGAVYAAMSGSGSTIYGIFDNLPNDTTCFDECFYKKTVPL